MPVPDSEKDGYLLSADKSRLDVGFVHDFLANHSHWASGVSRETVEKSIDNSLCFGLYKQLPKKSEAQKKPPLPLGEGRGEGRPSDNAPDAPHPTLSQGERALSQQVGFARLITDMTTFAYFSDVFMLESHRGKGIMRWMIQQILSLPEINNMRRVVLHSTYAQNFYAQFGFAPVSSPQNWMEIRSNKI